MGSAACVVGESTTEVVKYDPHTVSSTLTCSSGFTAVEVTKLTACGGERGKGHCYDKWKIEGIGGIGDGKGDYDDAACDKDKEMCAPDKILKANGTPLQACKWGSVPGVCMSRVAKRIDENTKTGGLKKQDCDGDDEACIPCIDPTNNQDTHTCKKMGVHTDACTGGKGASGITLCCHGVGICMDSENVPDGHASDMPKDSCTKDNQVCAPAAMIDSRPVACEVLGQAGVCLDTCFADMLTGVKAVARSSCHATEICLPCLIGKSQGMPGCNERL